MALIKIIIQFHSTVELGLFEYAFFKYRPISNLFTDPLMNREKCNNKSNFGFIIWTTNISPPNCIHLCCIYCRSGLLERMPVSEKNSSSLGPLTNGDTNGEEANGEFEVKPSKQQTEVYT